VANFVCYDKAEKLEDEYRYVDKEYLWLVHRGAPADEIEQDAFLLNIIPPETREQPSDSPAADCARIDKKATSGKKIGASGKDQSLLGGRIGIARDCGR